MLTRCICLAHSTFTNESGLSKLPRSDGQRGNKSCMLKFTSRTRDRNSADNGPNPVKECITARHLGALQKICVETRFGKDLSNLHASDARHFITLRTFDDRAVRDWPVRFASPRVSSSTFSGLHGNAADRVRAPLQTNGIVDTFGNRAQINKEKRNWCRDPH